LLRKFEEVIDTAGKAVERYPGNEDFFLARALGLRALNKWEAALADYSEAIRINPGSADYYYFRGETYKQMELWQEAYNDYSRAIAIKGDHEGALLDRGIIYGEAKLYRAAVADYTKVINLGRSNMVHGYGWRAETYRKMAEKAESEAVREEYERKAAEDTEMARSLGAYAGEAVKVLDLFKNPVGSRTSPIYEGGRRRH
jgi:tetratricopeptide (TPR) repeat protein